MIIKLVEKILNLKYGGLLEIEGSVAIITGAGSGMGAATAVQLANKGAKVAVLDNNQESATQMALKIGGIAVLCDVSDEQSVADAVAQVYEQIGLPRICINCAGITHAGRIVGREGPMPMDVFKKVININLVGTFNIMRLVGEMMYQLEPLQDNERGVFINTASVAAYEGQLGQIAYSASKGGVVSMTLPAAREFAKFGIRVMTIAPGPVATPMMEDASQEVLDELVAQMQFPKRFVQPQEYAALAEHIIENTSLNGETIRLDCGVRMH